MLRKSSYINRREYADAADAVADEILQSWAKQRELKRSNGHPCINRLLGRRCFGHGGCLNFPGSDHASLWNKAGRPHTYVTQPYQLNLKELEAISTFCREYKLEVLISAQDSWHFPGATILLEVTRNV